MKNKKVIIIIVTAFVLIGFITIGIVSLNSYLDLKNEIKALKEENELLKEIEAENHEVVVCKHNMAVSTVQVSTKIQVYYDYNKITKIKTTIEHDLSDTENEVKEKYIETLKDSNSNENTKFKLQGNKFIETSINKPTKEDEYNGINLTPIEKIIDDYESIGLTCEVQ